MKITAFVLNCLNAPVVHKLSPARLSQFLPFLFSGGSAGKELTCKSQKLLLNNGFIHPSSPGSYHLLPLIVRALEKLVAIVDKEMKCIGGQKMLLPCILSGDLWKASGRWESVGAELYKFCDRHSRDFCLGSTHEEAITELLSFTQPSYKNLPLKLYQITPKFRDEMRPRFGLLRNKEFWMKDMYTFDSTEETAKQSYHEVCGAYERIFHSLEVRPVKVEGDTGTIGGKFSHEYHILSEIGEDQILLCPKCESGVNAEITDEDSTCPQCNSTLVRKQGIEVAHAFFLGTKYSKVFKADYTSKDGKKELLQMGCFGLGITRLLAALVENFSLEENIQWPRLLAPFLICVIPPKAGSKEKHMAQFAEDIAGILNKIPNLQDNVVIDDRDHLTIGHRIADSTKIGVPFIVVVGKKATEDLPKLEVLDVCSGQQHVLLYSETIDFFRNIIQKTLV